MEQKKKAILSLSGGLDSTCLLLKLLAEGYDIRAYSFDYGQRHKIELKKLQKNLKLLKKYGIEVDWHLIDLKSAFAGSQSSLKIESSKDVPEGHYADESMKSTVVENRNVIFSAVLFGKALAWANETGEAVDIFLGIHYGDHTVYPDCTEESRAACEHAFKISNWNSEKVNYVAPFVNLEKFEVLKEGVAAMKKLEFPAGFRRSILRNTHSCYKPDEKGVACGKCGTCVERKEAFVLAKIKDPTVYSD